MSSKARFYLEQCIPEIDDLVEKKLFTKNEASAVMKKRTNFEHKLNSRGSSIDDYIRYINYETTFNKLRSKRVARILQSKTSNSISDWSIEKRIMFIYERGCQKFPKELRFWAMYLKFLKTRGNKTSYKKIHTVYNSLLRLHPNQIDVWISCAKYEYEVHANFKSCRTVLQNALKFNGDQRKLWYEYIKFELNFITKLINRRKVLNLINEREQELDMLNQEKENKNESDSEVDLDDGNSIFTKTISSGDKMKDKLNELPEADMNMLGNVETNPALRGDIALTIYSESLNSLGKYFISKHRGYYTEKEFQLSENLRKEVVTYLFEITRECINLFDSFKDLEREYLINYVIQSWHNEQFDISLQDHLPDLYTELLIWDITLNIRYATVENLDIDQLQLSVKKYFAYKSKAKPTSVKSLHSAYLKYLQEKLLSSMEKTDPRYTLIDQITKKL